MSLTNTEPTNKNFLSPLGFKFSIKKTPNVNFFVQSVNLPSITVGSTAIPSPFIRVPVTGDHLQFGDLTLTFKVDEDMTNYIEIFNWIKAIGKPDNFAQYDPQQQYSDATLTVLSSNYRVKQEIQFYDIFPVDLGGFTFMSTAGDVDYIETIATFRFRNFDFVAL